MSKEKIENAIRMEDCVGSYKCSDCERFSTYRKKLSELSENTRNIVSDVIGNKLVSLTVFSEIGKLSEISELTGDCKKYVGFIISHSAEDIEKILHGLEFEFGTNGNTDNVKARFEEYVDTHLPDNDINF